MLDPAGQVAVPLEKAVVGQSFAKRLLYSACTKMNRLLMRLSKLLGLEKSRNTSDRSGTSGLENLEGKRGEKK